MLPEERGRFCLSCQKKVVDFTHMSDTEIAQFFQQAKGSTCGRFTESQLNRNMVIPRKPLPWIRYFFQATLPALLLSLKASATSKVDYPTYISPLQSVASDTSIETGAVTAEGIVLDEDGKGLPFASIILKGTNRGVQTDSIGKFVFKGINTPAILVISSVGYVMQEVEIRPGQNIIQLELQISSAVLGEVVITGYAIAKRERKKGRIAKASLEEDKSKIVAYPNPLPAGGNLSIQCKKLDYGSYTMQLFNSAGVQVHFQKIDYTKGMSCLQVQTPHFVAGNYYLKLTHEKKGTSFTEQLIITL